MSEREAAHLPHSLLLTFFAFLRLGCTSFRGPVAHLGYFRSEFVHRRQWLSDVTFAELVGLAQSLPGPASSQVGFSIGLLRCPLLAAVLRQHDLIRNIDVKRAMLLEQFNSVELRPMRQLLPLRGFAAEKKW